MKNLFLALFVSFSLISIAQGNKTTQAEYNYLTKGYEIQIESGLDMKSGYEFVDIKKVETGSYSKYSFNFKLLVRSESRAIAGILIIAKSPVSGTVYYRALPINNPELMIKYQESISSWDSSMTDAYLFALSELYAELIQKGLKS